MFHGWAPRWLSFIDCLRTKNDRGDPGTTKEPRDPSPGDGKRILSAARELVTRGRRVGGADTTFWPQRVTERRLGGP